MKPLTIEWITKHRKMINAYSKNIMFSVMVVSLYAIPNDPSCSTIFSGFVVVIGCFSSIIFMITK